MSALDSVRTDLAGIEMEDNPRIVQQKSRDFYWYSPVLKRQLDAVSGDLVVSPRNEAEVIRILKSCYRNRVPVTVRGGGTGNYGQAMPLAGGVVLSMAAMDTIVDIAPDRVIAGPGAIIRDIDLAAREKCRRELRMHPSTTSTASLGGFIAGGSGGVGSIRWGGLRDLGNILRIRVVTMEEEPRILDLTGLDLHKVSHAYGTNGVITEIEMPLTAAHDWIDVLVAFDEFAEAARYANALALQDGLLVKEIAPIGAPAPHAYFKRHRKFLAPDQSVVVVMVAPQSIDAFTVFTAREGGQPVYRSDTMDSSGLPVAYELAWNHTTLRALRVDPAITYLQVLYPFPDHLERVARVHAPFGDELVPHLEFVRFDGNITCFGLPLLRYTTDDRLEEIIRFHEDNGCPIFNPHRYTLEEGGMKATDAVQLDFKRQADPLGLLNPGKMIGWENPDFDLSGQKTYLFPGLEANV